MATKTKSKAKVVTLTASEIREKIGDLQHEVAVKIPDELLHGDLKGLSARVAAFAKENSIPGTAHVGNAPVREQCGTHYVYNYPGPSRRVPYYRTLTRLCVIGKRAFTDDELVADGKKLIAKAERAAKQRAKDELKLSSLAAKLGKTVSD